MSQDTQDFPSPCTELALLPLMLVLLHLRVHPACPSSPLCISLSPAHLPPDTGKVSTDKVKQQALVCGFNSLVKSIRQCQRLWVWSLGDGRVFLGGLH